MSETGQATPQVADRKTLLAQQFDEVEQTAAVDSKPEKIAATIEATPTTGERARDEKGKFAPKEIKTQSAGATAPAPADPALEAWAKPPKSWKKELGEGWGKLDPTYQRYVHEREAQMHAGIEPLLPRAELADKLTKAAEPYMNTIRGLGLELPQAVAGLMKVDHDLRTLPHEQKLQRLAQVALSYGVDLSGQMQHAQQAFDPNMQAIQNELLGIKGQFSNFMQQQEAQQQRTAQDEILSFAKTAEHFEDVKPMMVQLLQGGLAENLEEAYEKAIRLSPELFDQIQTAKQAGAEAEKRAAADAAAKRAKAAAVSVKSATPGAAKTTNAQDRRSMLREQLDGLSERL